jgi:hypothetical protein
MSAVPTAFAITPPEQLNDFEAEFVRTVLEHRGLFHVPTSDEFRGALDVLRHYEQLCAASPSRVDSFASRLPPIELAALRAKAYVMFGTIWPSAAQWHKAHTALFGPLLCETCI